MQLYLYLKAWLCYQLLDNVAIFSSVGKMQM